MLCCIDKVLFSSLQEELGVSSEMYEYISEQFELLVEVKRRSLYVNSLSYRR